MSAPERRLDPDSNGHVELPARKGPGNPHWRPASGIPARQWAETETVHGAYSPRRVNPLAEAIHGHLVANNPHLTPSDNLEVWALARAEAKTQLVSEWLDRVEAGEIKANDHRIELATRNMQRWERQAQSSRDRLGLSPLARARIGKELHAPTTADLAKMFAELTDENQAIEAELVEDLAKRSERKQNESEKK